MGYLAVVENNERNRAILTSRITGWILDADHRKKMYDKYIETFVDNTELFREEWTRYMTEDANA